MEAYYSYQIDLEKKYGARSVIVMMVGSFYEIYEFEGVGKACTLSSMLNICLTKKDKKKELSRTNPYMCGFPSHSLRKFVDILVRQFAYTVGIVNQMEDTEDSISSSRQRKRDLEKVYSPCIPYEYDFESDNDYGLPSVDSSMENVCLVVSVQRQARNHLSKDQRFFLSYIVLNLTFGNVYYGEEEFASFAEVCETVLHLCMKEHVQEAILLDTCPKMDKEGRLEAIMGNGILFHRHDDMNGKYRLLAYQQKVLSRVYSDTLEESVICELDLERHPFIVQYLVFLFDFVYDHCPLVLSRLKRPVHMRTQSHVHYNIRTYYELNVLNQRVMDSRRNKSDASLIDMVDKTCTPMGGRFLRHLFFVPTYDMTELEKRYDRVQYYVDRREVLSQRRLLFNTMGDLERKYRMMCLDRISPKDTLHVLRICQSVLEQDVFRDMIPLDMQTMLQNLLSWTCQHWEWNGMEESRTSTKIETPFFLHEDENAKEWKRTYRADYTMLESFVRRTQDQCQIRMGVHDDVSIVTTKRKWTSLKPVLEREGVHVVETKSSGCTLHSHTLDACTTRLQCTMQKLRKSWREQFSFELGEMRHSFGRALEAFCRLVAEEDAYMSFAHVSVMHRYCRPIITTSSDGSSMVAKNVRHAIIEKIQESEAFVGNDVELHDSRTGMLVYGLNSAGKSTLLKSIGLAVIMAQVGMFVPCSSFHLRPFHTLLSKIYIMDNLYKGQSTFLYELNELKTILRQCDSHSLVLCDELTAGTETYSATGLMASTVLHCIGQRARFIFTTHLHTLANVREITENPRLDIVHFGVSVVNGKIQYNRKIAKGMGSSLYGIEIADALGFPSTFTKTAFDIRNRVSGERESLVVDQRSRYNKRLIMDTCERCGTHENLHTHHIMPQSQSDESGFIGTFHKNRSFNLEVLCKKCHIAEHRDHDHDKNIPTTSKHEDVDMSVSPLLISHNPFSKFMFAEDDMCLSTDTETNTQTISSTVTTNARNYNRRSVR